MKTYHWWSRLSVALLVGLVVAGALSAGPASSRPKPPPQPPFGCFTDAWAEHFDVVSMRWDAKKYEVIWVLKAKKDATMRAYRAELSDPDGVAVGVVGVRFNPNQTTVKKGTQIEATISVVDVTVSDIGICNIREHR